MRPGSKPGETAEGETAFFKALDEDVERVRKFVEDSPRRSRRVAQLDVDVHEAHREGLPDLPLTEPAATLTTSTTSSSSDGDDHLGLDIGQSMLNSRAIETVENLRDALHAVQDDFLRIEKFANPNTTAVKILKKHDKLIPRDDVLPLLPRATSQPTLDSRGSQRRVRGRSPISSRCSEGR